MKRFYLEKELAVNEQLILEDDLYNQIINVLRMNKGDKLILFNGSELDYVCEIFEILKKKVVINVLSAEKNKANPIKNITLFQALVKGEKLELITQKITEIGVSKLVPFVSTFCDVKENTAKINRLPKITIEACKQCGRSIPVEICEPIKFNKVLELLQGFDMVVFAYEKADKPLNIEAINAQNIAIVVGSEGGFSENEAQSIAGLKNALTISLGNTILRAETAAITLSSTIKFLAN